MANPLKGGIAKQVYKAMKKAKMTLPATLIKVTPGTRTPTNLSGGTNPTETSYTARGFIDYEDDDIDGTIVQRGDRIVSLFGASMTSGIFPANGDKVTMDGATYRIIHVRRDPAAALYECQARL